MISQLLEYQKYNPSQHSSNDPHPHLTLSDYQLLLHCDGSVSRNENPTLKRYYYNAASKKQGLIWKKDHSLDTIRLNLRNSLRIIEGAIQFTPSDRKQDIENWLKLLTNLDEEELHLFLQYGEKNTAKLLLDLDQSTTTAISIFLSETVEYKTIPKIQTIRNNGRSFVVKPYARNQYIPGAARYGLKETAAIQGQNDGLPDIASLIKTLCKNEFSEKNETGTSIFFDDKNHQESVAWITGVDSRLFFAEGNVWQHAITHVCDQPGSCCFAVLENQTNVAQLRFQYYFQKGEISKLAKRWVEATNVLPVQPEVSSNSPQDQTTFHKKTGLSPLTLHEVLTRSWSVTDGKYIKSVYNKDAAVSFRHALEAFCGFGTQNLVKPFIESNGCETIAVAGVNQLRRLYKKSNVSTPASVGNLLLPTANVILNRSVMSEKQSETVEWAQKMGAFLAALDRLYIVHNFDEGRGKPLPGMSSINNMGYNPEVTLGKIFKLTSKMNLQCKQDLINWEKKHSQNFAKDPSTKKTPQHRKLSSAYYNYLETNVDLDVESIPPNLDSLARIALVLAYNKASLPKKKKTESAE